VWYTAARDFGPGQWYRAAPWLDSGNSPGTAIVIGDSGTAGGRSGESVAVDGNGNVIVLLAVKNAGKGTVRYRRAMALCPGNLGVRQMKAHVLSDGGP
jgi:hypothetical protein